jgi:hypothetical protein
MSADHYEDDTPWLRQPCDTATSWPWASEFINAGPSRSLATLAKRDGCPWTANQLGLVAHEGLWRERALAWDTHLRDLRVMTIEAVVEEDARSLAKKHGKPLAMMRGLAERELELLTEAQRKSNILGIINPGLIVRMLETAIKYERLLIGEVTDRVQTAGPDLSKLSIEEIRALKDIATKLETV